MTFHLIGLGRMGRGVGYRLSQKGVPTFGFDPDTVARDEAGKYGIEEATSIEGLAKKGAPGSRVFWIMVKAGETVDSVIASLLPQLAPGDIVVDAGNSHYPDAKPRAQLVATKKASYLDIGTSGGVKGKDVGFCLMVGGDKAAYEKIKPQLAHIATPEGYSYLGPAGAGHFVKMVHNAIEYGVLQVLGEGFWLLEDAPFDLNLGSVAQLWNRGSVIRSWLLDLVSSAMQEGKNFSEIKDVVGGGETGRWAVLHALEKEIPIPLITQALAQRMESSKEENFAWKLIAGLRREFGDHPTKAK